jgi:hypothetical protein
MCRIDSDGTDNYRECCSEGPSEASYGRASEKIGGKISQRIVQPAMCHGTISLETKQSNIRNGAGRKMLVNVQDFERRFGYGDSANGANACPL